MDGDKPKMVVFTSEIGPDGKHGSTGSWSSIGTGRVQIEIIGSAIDPDHSTA
jgi:hypothetical protein